jgi:hypothetical protein
MSAMSRSVAAGKLRAGGLSAAAMLHLAVGAAMTLLIVAIHPREGDPLPFLLTADKLAAGGVAYRNITSEYPPLALVPMTLPRMLAGTSHAQYQTWFSVISIALFVATLCLVYWIARRRWSAESPADAVAMFLGLGGALLPVVVWRFDILPAFLTAVAVAAYVARRPGWTGLGLGLGAMAKLYPVFLGPVFVAAALVDRRWKDAALIVVAAACTAAVVLALPVLVAGSHAFSYIQYQQSRGIEIESIEGGLAAYFGAFQHVTTFVRVGFGSWQVSSGSLVHLTTPIKAFNAIVVTVTVVACVVSFVRDRRASGAVQPRTMIKYLTAAVLAILLTNKVVSPQYLVWLLPFAALLPWRQSLLLVGIGVLTTLVYPLNFRHLLDLEPPEVILLNARNLLLVVAFIWIVIPERRAGRRMPVPSPASAAVAP